MLLHGVDGGCHLLSDVVLLTCDLLGITFEVVLPLLRRRPRVGEQDFAHSACRLQGVMLSRHKTAWKVRQRFKIDVPWVDADNRKPYSRMLEEHGWTPV